MCSTKLLNPLHHHTILDFLALFSWYRTILKKLGRNISIHKILLPSFRSNADSDLNQIKLKCRYTRSIGFELKSIL